MQNCNPRVYNRKRIKKKVKFVDEVYNKNLVEEIQIKSFKMYNKGNNYVSGRSTTNCNVFRNAACCNIF